MIHCSPCPGCTCIHVSYSRSCEYSAIPVYAHACVLCMRCDYIFPRIFVRPAIPVYAYVCVHYVCAVRSVMTILSLHVLCMCCDHVSSVHVLCMCCNHVCAMSYMFLLYMFCVCAVTMYVPCLILRSAIPEYANVCCVCTVLIYML